MNSLIVAVTLVTLASGSTIPFQFESDCFINLILPNSSFKHQNGLKSRNSQVEYDYFDGLNVITDYALTFAVRQRGAVVDVIDVVEITEDNINITISDRYFRYQVRQRSTCILFILLTEGLNETTLAIHESGYGTSSNAVFFVHTSKASQENEVISSFRNFLFSSDWENAFHASVIFFDDVSTLGVFCYFCPNTSAKLHIINEPSPIPLSKLSAIDDLLNQNGHGKRLKLFNGAQYSWPTLSKCLSRFQDKRENYQHFHNALGSCSPLQSVVFATLQDALNVTLILPNVIVFDEEKREMEWFLRIHYGDGLMGYIPNVQLFTRGSYVLVAETSLDMIACRDYRCMSVLDFYFRTILDATLWLAVALLAFLYSFTFKNAALGIHFIWLFLGVHDTSRHSRNQTGFIVLSVAALGYIYQGYINTDAMYVTKFPTLIELAKLKYRIWLWPGDTKGTTETGIVSLGRTTQRKLQPLIDAAGGAIRDVLHDESDREYIMPSKHGFRETLETISKNSLIAPGQDHSSLRARIGNGVKNVEHGGFLCLVMNLREELNADMNILLGYRIYGYMEKRAGKDFDIF